MRKLDTPLGEPKCKWDDTFSAQSVLMDTYFNGAPELRQPSTIATLAGARLVYLGTPYTKYAAGLDAAFQDAARIAARLLIEGVRVYSPIAHTHPLATYGNIDPRNHDIWLPFDQVMMDAADCMCVAKMDGWSDSYGVRFEIDTFRKAGKPVYSLDVFNWTVDNTF